MNLITEFQPLNNMLWTDIVTNNMLRTNIVTNRAAIAAKNALYES